jgi:hypothetical protein
MAAGFTALALAAAVAAIALPASCGIEGAYFDRSVSAPASVGAFALDTGICWVPEVLGGAAAAFALCAVTTALIAWRLRWRGAI